MKVEPVMLGTHIIPDFTPYRDSLKKLTPRQYECLTWVGRGLKTKRIALTLGISPGRVDKHILDARGKMGGMGRDEAGMIVAAYEASLGNETGGHLLGAQLLGLFPAPEDGPSALADDDADAQSRRDGRLVDEQGVYPLVNSTLSPLVLVPLRPDGRQGNDLKRSYILTMITVLAAAALASLGSAVSLLTSFDTLARH